MLLSGLFRKYRRLPHTAFMPEAVADYSHVCWGSAEEQCGCRSLKNYKGTVREGFKGSSQSVVDAHAGPNVA